MSSSRENRIHPKTHQGSGLRALGSGQEPSSRGVNRIEPRAPSPEPRAKISVGRSSSPSADTVFSRYLRSGVRSTSDAVAYLGRRGVSSEAAARLVKAGAARGLLDDRAAARLWAEHFVRQGYAASGIEQKLLAKGFDEAVTAQVIGRCASASSEEARARTLAARYTKAPARRTQAARITRALTARGFDAEMIARVVDEQLGCESTEISQNEIS